jgi:hypothetical protein
MLVLDNAATADQIRPLLPGTPLRPCPGDQPGLSGARLVPVAKNVQ